MAFAERMASRSAGAATGEMFLVTGGKDASGREAWYYVLIPPIKSSLFLKAISSGNVRLTEYGSIVESGFGVMPSAAIKDRMQREYGFTGT